MKLLEFANKTKCDKGFVVLIHPQEESGDCFVFDTNVKLEDVKYLPASITKKEIILIDLDKGNIYLEKDKAEEDVFELSSKSNFDVTDVVADCIKSLAEAKEEDDYI